MAMHESSDICLLLFLYLEIKSYSRTSAVDSWELNDWVMYLIQCATHLMSNKCYKSNKEMIGSSGAYYFVLNMSERQKILRLLILSVCWMHTHTYTHTHTHTERRREGEK
jgi:hypothetical protein